MKALIVEDELIAARTLIKTIEENFSDISILGSTTSISETVDWLNNPNNKADIIFMDIELSDGKCFEIFKRIDINVHVIITTAYDRYAIKAFEVNSIDYLLKPIDISSLKRAVERCRKSSEIKDIGSLIQKITKKDISKTYKERLLVHLNDHIVPINMAEILCFFSKTKDNHVVTKAGRMYIIDSSLDVIMKDLNPTQFFKISRRCIIAKDAVDSISKLFGGRLSIILKDNIRKVIGTSHEDLPDLTVSRTKVDDFLKWLEN